MGGTVKPMPIDSASVRRRSNGLHGYVVDISQGLRVGSNEADDRY
jgi:hypothetical protein